MNNPHDETYSVAEISEVLKLWKRSHMVNEMIQGLRGNRQWRALQVKPPFAEPKQGGLLIGGKNAGKWMDTPRDADHIKMMEPPKPLDVSAMGPMDYPVEPAYTETYTREMLGYGETRYKVWVITPSEKNLIEHLIDGYQSVEVFLDALENELDPGLVQYIRKKARSFNP